MKLLSLWVNCVCVWCVTYLKYIKKKEAFLVFSLCCGYLSTSTGAPSAAYCVATDSSCEPGLQQLLSPGVQAVQLLHGAWHDDINRVTLDTYTIDITDKQW